jgi:aryl-alcohol dehydrogenase-like predicted oxidoreductase
MSLSDRITLGRTGLKVGQLGISSSFGASASVYEEAFERGCNYFTWGTFIKGDSSQMKKAIRNLTFQGRRDDLVIAVNTYAHNAFLTKFFLNKRLKALGIDHIDVLILGYFSKPPSDRILEGANKLKEKGLVRYIGITSHNRKMYQELSRDSGIDVLHVRYNPAHRGAEKDVFPYFKFTDRPGIVSYTATRWGKLLNPNKMPPGEKPLTAADCYRYVLANSSIDVCMMGVKNMEELRENLAIFDAGSINNAEKERIERIGAFVHDH